MFKDTLTNARLYADKHPLFGAAFDYLRNFDPSTSDGKYVLEEGRLVAMPQSYETGPVEQKKFEAHRKFIDIQYMVSGEEKMLVRPLDSGLTMVQDYLPEKDVLFFKVPEGATDYQEYRAGDFGIFYPEDVHQPGCQLAGPAKVRKVVMKVAV